MKNQREFILSKASNAKAWTECKVAVIEAPERYYQSRCQALLLVLNKFTFVSWNSVVEFGERLGYMNVTTTLETSMNLIVQSQQQQN